MIVGPPQYHCLSKPSYIELKLCMLFIFLSNLYSRYFFLTSLSCYQGQFCSVILLLEGGGNVSPPNLILGDKMIETDENTAKIYVAIRVRI